MPDMVSDDRTLADRLAEICARYPSAQPRLVADVVRAVVDALGAELSSHEKELLGEVEELGRTIEVARREIAALRAEGQPRADVLAASDELDAVVAHTADATNAILEACEELDAAAAGAAGPSAADVQNATTRIYEACSFQDITGQRITKVVGTLKAVEAKVARIVATFGQHQWDIVEDHGFTSDQRPDSHLLNGPQLPTSAMGQDDIDALLA